LIFAPQNLKPKKMKPLKSIIPMVVAVALTFTAFAQQQQQPSTQKQPAPAPAQQTPAKQTSPKDEWMKQYNAWKPQLDKYMQKAKENGDKNADFNKEAKSLNDMATTYRQKIDRYDNATADEKAKYADMMKADAKKITDQGAKVKAMYDKNWPSAEKKEAPKQPQK
jgi:uncharacterized coiled-coil DUF342 family protein